MDDARLAIAKLTGDDLEALFREIIAISARTLEVERAGIWMFVHDRTALHCVALFERSPNAFSAGVTLQVADFPQYFGSIASRKTIPAEMAASDPRTQELGETYLAPLGIEAMLDASIICNGEVIGVVCHEHIGGPREWTTEERDFAGSVADAVALKMKTAELGQAQRLRLSGVAEQAEFRQRNSVTQLAAGVAHDFRNLLMIVLGHAQEIRLEPGLPAGIGEQADAILDAANRGAELAAQLMEIAGNQAGHPRVFEVGGALRRVLPLLQSAVGDHHRIEFAAAASPGRVFLDPSQLERVLLNLVINARDAMRDGGTIHVALCDEDAANPARHRHMVLIEVRDHGTGIDPAVRPRIFDPFFTTKSRRAGSGLGLAVVKHAVDIAGGHVDVESTPGEGATFRVYLPRVGS